MLWGSTTNQRDRVWVSTCYGQVHNSLQQGCNIQQVRQQAVQQSTQHQISGVWTCYSVFVLSATLSETVATVIMKLSE